jgi:hypothetical protein
MKQTGKAQRAQPPVVDYSAARARAIAWLGDGYLLARPINRKPSPQNRRVIINPRHVGTAAGRTRLPPAV